jgi:hypothetical protein
MKWRDYSFKKCRAAQINSGQQTLKAFDISYNISGGAKNTNQVDHSQ